MPIIRKPKPAAAAAPGIDVNALINKGGGVARQDAKAEAGEKAEADEKATSPVVLRVPNRFLRRIDQALASRPFKMPRHTWLLEAVLEKLEREEA